MASERLFVDSSGWYAVLNQTDGAHKEACRIFKSRAVKSTLLTTEYVLVETATLLRARKVPHLERNLFTLVDATSRLQVVWSSLPFFTHARDFFLKHQDHGWSFTDCTSFVLMREEGLRDALTTDRHFKQAGIVPLLKA